MWHRVKLSFSWRGSQLFEGLVPGDTHARTPTHPGRFNSPPPKTKAQHSATLTFPMQERDSSPVANNPAYVVRSREGNTGETRRCTHATDHTTNTDFPAATYTLMPSGERRLSYGTGGEAVTWSPAPSASEIVFIPPLIWRS